VFFPAGKKSYEKAVKYEGNRDLDGIYLKFIFILKIW
jgi:hypothetical protein